MDNPTSLKTLDFSFDGYQVVRGEFFAHTFEPSFTFNNYKVSVNMACIKKLPSVEYVQILVNPEEKKLAVRPCREEEKRLFPLVFRRKKEKSKTDHLPDILCESYLFDELESYYRYKLLGKLIRSGDEVLFIFDLDNPGNIHAHFQRGRKAKSISNCKLSF